MPSFARILLKLSGEFLREGEDCFSPSQLKAIAVSIAAVQARGIQVAVVVGGGNILRGRSHSSTHNQADVDQVGMLATLMNVGMLRFALEAEGLKCRLFAPRTVHPVAEAFDRREAVEALDQGEIVLLGGGTGNPFFSTDSAAALRAAELQCDALLKATLVDGVYDKDPNRHADAVRFDTLSFDEALRRNLKVMDQTAIALCRDRNMKVVVFSIQEPRNLLKVVEGSLQGTVMESSADL